MERECATFSSVHDFISLIQWLNSRKIQVAQMKLKFVFSLSLSFAVIRCDSGWMRDDLEHLPAVAATEFAASRQKTAHLHRGGSWRDPEFDAAAQMSGAT